MSTAEAGSSQAVPPAAKQSWGQFLKSLASFNGDLSTMTAPPSILSSTSLTEYSSYWAEHPSIFVAPANEQDPAKRALLVTKWFLTTLKQQYSSRSEKLGGEKKPLNPFLGELFLGKWEDDAGTTQLVSEQVSHHPPVTAYSVRNDKHGVYLQGYNGQKASFSTRIDVRQVGHALLHLQKFDENYLITLPSLHIDVITSAPYVELNGKTFITSSSGFTAKIDYSGKGWFSGSKNSFHAVLYADAKPTETLYTIDGCWTGEITISQGKSKVDSWNGKTAKTTPLKVAPVEEQDELESRRAWSKVAKAINNKDLAMTSQEKTLIETSQRELRKKEINQGTEWQRVFFSKVRKSPEFDALGPKIGERVREDGTGGIWRYDEEKAKTAQKPYRPGTLPQGP